MSDANKISVCSTSHFSIGLGIALPFPLHFQFRAGYLCGQIKVLAKCFD